MNVKTLFMASYNKKKKYDSSDDDFETATASTKKRNHFRASL